MDEEEKELLYRIDERTDSMKKQMDSVEGEVRNIHEVTNNRLNKHAKKINNVDDIANANTQRLTAALFIGGSVISATVAHVMGLITL
jgi:chromosome segregation ATPase